MGNDSELDMERLFLGNGYADLFKVRRQAVRKCKDNKRSYKGCDLFGNGRQDLHRNGDCQRQVLHDNKDRNDTCQFKRSQLGNNAIVDLEQRLQDGSCTVHLRKQFLAHAEGNGERFCKDNCGYLHGGGQDGLHRNGFIRRKDLH